MAAAAEGIRAVPCDRCIESDTVPPLWDLRNCGGEVEGPASPFFLRVPGATWYRCPYAEIADDPMVTELMTLYWDMQRHSIRPPTLDDVPAIETMAFRIIDRAISEVRAADEKRAAREREHKAATAQQGGRGNKPAKASTSASMARIRAQGQRRAMRKR